jgi:hypothetical protein
MADLASVLAGVGCAVAGCGLIPSFRGQLRRSWWLFLAGNAVCAVSNLVTRSWPFAAVNVATVLVFAWLLWRRRRRKRAPRAYGAKSRARLAALARKAREAARPRPVRRLAPQGLS